METLFVGGPLHGKRKSFQGRFLEINGQVGKYERRVIYKTTEECPIDRKDEPLIRMGWARVWLWSESNGDRAWNAGDVAKLLEDCEWEWSDIHTGEKP